MSTFDGLGDKITGTAKEAAGKLTGDKDLEAEGKLDKAEGAIKDAAGDVAAGFRAVADRVKDTVDGDR